MVSVVVPVYNEAPVLEALVTRVSEVLADCHHELILVNDGSTDASFEVLEELAAAAPEIKVLHLSRNFGQQAAVQAGLTHAAGDAVIVMDADLQDDPKSLLLFLDKWRQGYDVVYAVRTGRKESLLKRFLFGTFYRLLRIMARTRMPLDAGNFGLIDGRVAKEIAILGDRDRYYPGLRAWVGYRQIGVTVERGPRYDGEPRVTWLGLWRLAKAAVFSFSSFPLTVFYLLAGMSVATFLGLGSFALYHKFFTGLAIPGWTSYIMTACLFGALNAFGIAILGDYVLRIYDQVRERPLYLVGRRTNFDEPPSKKE